MSDAQPTNHSLLQASRRTCLLFLLRENTNQLTNKALWLRTRIFKDCAAASKLLQDFVVFVCHTCLHFFVTSPVVASLKLLSLNAFLQSATEEQLLQQDFPVQTRYCSVPAFQTLSAPCQYRQGAA